MSRVHVPSVEDRLYEVRHALALSGTFIRAFSNCEDLGLHQEDKMLAFAKMADILQSAGHALRAAKTALDDDAMCTEAPEVE